MERHVILLLALTAVGLGTANAVLRPGVFQLGQRTPGVFGSGVSWRTAANQRLDHASGARPGSRTRWERFQGRGPGGAK